MQEKYGYPGIIKHSTQVRRYIGVLLRLKILLKSWFSKYDFLELKHRAGLGLLFRKVKITAHLRA